MSICVICVMCNIPYEVEDSDADQPSRFCSSDCEIDYYENQGPVVDGDDEDDFEEEEEDNDEEDEDLNENETDLG